MTAKDAFAIAFDEQVVMDAMPGNDMPKNSLPQKPSAPSGLKKNAAAAPGADTSMGGEKSLSQHMQEGCDAVKNGHPEKCPYIKKIAKDLEQSQGLDHDAAMQQAIGLHNAAGVNNGQPQPQQQQTQPQVPNPAMQEQAVQQMAQNPQAIETAQSQMLNQPEELDTSAGEIPVQTTVQKAIVENLENAAATGDPKASEALGELKEKVDDGEISASPEQPETGQVPPPAQGEVQQPEQEGAGSGVVVTPEQQEGHFNITSSDGTLTVPLGAEEIKIIQANPDKAELYQKMVDVEAAFQNSKDDAEKKDLNDSLRILKRMFYGEERTSENASETGEPAKETLNTEGDGGGNVPPEDGGSTTNPPNNEPPEGSSSQPPPPNNPPPANNTTPDEDNNEEEDVRQQPSKAPDDEEFRVKGKNNEYKIGGMTYVDVSGKGLLRTALSSFLAGIQGKGIITGWDRINGTWDQMKRSEKGEMVRDGITSALLRDGIAKYADKEGLSEDAKMEMAVIQDMLNKAKTPEAQMKALKQFQKWKETYSTELGELDEPQTGATFKPLPNDYKGKKPPLSILEKPKGFTADKEFGDKVAAAIQDRLGTLGFPVESLEGVSVGPSATTVRFKIPPTFDMSSAKSAKTREALKGATGTDISKVEYAKGETDVLAITITNPEMRTVGFSDMMASKKWKEFSEKAAVPMALGRDSSGEETYLDAATMPQTIVTGATGSGKSVFISSAINSVEMAKTPDQVRIVLLDPKNEFKVQDGSPHLLFPRAGGDPDKAKASKDMADVLDSLVAVMNERVTKIGGVIEGFNPTKNEFKGAADHSIKQYNASHPDDHMPHILLVFDEIANARDNATAEDQKRIDLALQKITAIGRSVGVNCLLATQRDDVGSIPGIIQANCPGRVTFKASPTDAKASQEAKSLAGNGDYILTDKGGNKTRGRGCFISPKEELAVPSYYRDHMEGSPEEEEEPSVEEAAEHSESEKPTEPVEASAEGVEEETGEDWTSADNRDDAIAILGKVRDSAKAKAFEEYKKSKKTSADRNKYKKAVEKAEADYNDEMSIVDSQFPEQIKDGDEFEGETSKAESSETKESDDDEDEELALFPSPQRQLEQATEGLKKQIAKWQKAIGSGEMTAAEAKKLHTEAMQRLKAAKKAIKDGVDGKKATGEQIHSILNPMQKPAETAEPVAATPSENSTENPELSPEDTAAQEEEKKNEQRRNSVPPQKGYSEKTIAGSYEATERLTPKDQKNIQEHFLPDGWEFVTENGFNAPAKNKFGVIFVRDPKTGSVGRLIPDKANPKSLKFQKDIDTTHPDYKGYVKNAQGEWELSPEAKKVEEETRLDRKQSRDPKKREEALKRFNRARFGHDEAPDNATIVANAVAQALELINGD